MTIGGWVGGCLPWLEPRTGRVRKWDVRREGTYRGARGDEWTIPVGFSTDLASIPWPLRWLVDTWGAHTGAALLHDWLCHLVRGATLGQRMPGQGHVTRREADGLFRRTLLLGGTHRVLAWLMYLAVRIGSRFDGGMDRDEWVRCALVLPLGLLAVAVSVPLVAVRALVEALGWLVERWRR